MTPDEIDEKFEKETTNLSRLASSWTSTAFMFHCEFALKSVMNRLQSNQHVEFGNVLISGTAVIGQYEVAVLYRIGQINYFKQYFIEPPMEVVENDDSFDRAMSGV